MCAVVELRIYCYICKYILQCNRSKFYQHEVNATCPLCQLEDEDTLHLLIKCNALYVYRKESMKELKDIINDIDESSGEFCQMTLIY